MDFATKTTTLFKTPFVKKAFLSALTVLSLNAAFAQDTLYKRNGEMQQVKVTEVNSRTISFKKAENLNGPTYVVDRADVEKIKYESGSIEYFNEAPAARGPHARAPRALPMHDHNQKQYGKNILSFAPVQMTNTSVTGLGVHFEHMFDKKGMFALYIPLVWSINTNDNSYYNGYGYQNQSYSMFWTYPGLKIYPAGSNHKVCYGVGPSIAIGAGTRPYTTVNYDPNTGNSYSVTTNKDVFQMGIMVNNSLNIQPTPHLYLGVEMGLGIPYIHNNDDNNYNGNNYNYSDVPLVQFNFKIGYRF
ncbi:hypothetical protein [Taibaiella soli]|uniref:Outer membrane protein beta-barrel domain-containing protein n=1 Tax=Taibaiella soli TaxID=1649169 RepID=A0A2W2A775_9BACT|nr:hypothetical protein [Taibaiella soli]PZF71165.1 hypothetical protein DN068_19510 [Taibaiella soli]